jgi:hypothetical protein
MSKKEHKDFLAQLQDQARLQANLNTTRILPRQADVLTAFIGNHPWQTLVMLSTISTILMVVSGKV